MVLDYYRPGDTKEALEFLGKSPRSTKILAGGTDLIIQMRERSVAPEYIIDIGGIPELREIKITGDKLVIGGTATFSGIENSLAVKQYFPILSRAAGSVGSPQIRNTGTIGGNIVNAAPAADMIPALLALEARVELRGPSGDRTPLLEEILVSVNKTGIRPDEILTGVNMTLPGPGTYSSFVKLGRRKALAIARLNLGLVMAVEGKRVSSCSLALGSVGVTAYRVREVEELLAGKELNDSLEAAACRLLSETVAKKLGTRPTASYKKVIAAAALKRAFAEIRGLMGGMGQ